MIARLAATPLERGGVELDGRPVAGDGDDLVERERSDADGDGCRDGRGLGGRRWCSCLRFHTAARARGNVDVPCWRPGFQTRRGSHGHRVEGAGGRPDARDPRRTSPRSAGPCPPRTIAHGARHPALDACTTCSPSCRSAGSSCTCPRSGATGSASPRSSCRAGSAGSSRSRASAAPSSRRSSTGSARAGHLAVLHGRDVLYLVEERAPRRPSLVTDVGVRLPAHLTATGRAMLAALPPRAGARAVSRPGGVRDAASARRGRRDG